MTDRPAESSGSASEIPHDEWPTWCKSASDRLSGRGLNLYYQDVALGEVRLADGQPFVALEHDVVAEMEALTVKYGDGVVPVRHVIAEPSEVLQRLDAAGDIDLVTILDSTGRKTFISLA